MRVQLFGHAICCAAFVADGFNKPSYLRRSAMISAEGDRTWSKLRGKLEIRMTDEDEIVPFTTDELDLIYSSGVSPVHLRMYHSILSEYASKGKSEEALSLFEEMNTNDVYPNEKTYEYLIESLIRSESIDCRSKLNEVEMTFKQLIQSGLQPSQDIAAMLIDFYGAIDLPDLAEVVFDRVSFAGTACEAPVYNALLLAWGNSSRTNSPVKAEEVMRRMEFAGIEANLVTYERLLFSWSKSKRSDAALKSYSILQRMQAVGITPSMKCYELVLTAFAHSSGSEYLDYAIEIMASLNTRSSVAECPIPSANTSISRRDINTDDDNGTSANVSVVIEAVGPSQQCYDSCVLLWAKSGRDDAPEVQ
jgi:pentatricopeptide repeat protein